MPGTATCKRYERLEIEFLTCLISYNMCDIQNSEKRVNGINYLRVTFRRDFCDTDRSSVSWSIPIEATRLPRRGKGFSSGG